MVEFTRILQPRSTDDDELRDQVSPDGSQAFIITLKADVAGDKNVYQIQLLDLRPERLSEQRSPAPAAVFTVAAKDDDEYLPAIRNVQWHDDRTLVFLGRLDGALDQVYSLDVHTRSLSTLTHEANPIISFAVSQDLRRVVYAVQVPNPPLHEGAHAVVVGIQSFWAVKSAQNDLRSQDWKYRYAVADVASSLPGKPLGGTFVGLFGTKPTVSISPDGRWALLPRWDPERLADWEQRYPMVQELSKGYAVSQHIDPLGYFSTPVTYVPRRLTAWRLDDAREQAIVDAPDDVHRGGPGPRDTLWQGNGTSVILAGTFLPATSDGKTPSASHIIEYWPDQGRWTDIAALDGRLEKAYPLRGGFLILDGERRREFRRQPGGGWRESPSGEAAQAPNAASTLRFVQGLNQPPDIYAEGPSGGKTRLTELNPQFDADKWGTMQPYAWHDSSGRQWKGGLMYGSGVDPHKRYPLVIQTYGFAPDRFYLDGPNLIDGATSAFAGRAFLREGILVLQMPISPTGAAGGRDRQAFRDFDAGVRSAVETLAREGRIDPAKVGIMGWSMTGERVLNLLTFGDFPIRAATMADADSTTVFTYTITYGKSDIFWAMFESTNEGSPYGDSLGKWVRNDPALHTDCVHAALRIESYGPTVTPNWDIYALLRRQYKPVEMILLPKGTHSLLTPGDRMASLQGNVDWYAYWLAGKERTSPMLATETESSLRAQYERWRQMDRLKVADDVRPRCTR